MAFVSTQEFTARGIDRDGLVADVVLPVPGSTLPSNQVTFEWEDVDADRYILSVGSTPGGSDIFNRRGVGGSTSWRVGNIPIDGSKVYVTIEAQAFGEVFTSIQEFTAINVNDDEFIVDIVSPSPDSTLSSSQVTFQWEDVSADRYILSVGSIPGGSDIFNRRGVGRSTSWRVGNIPTDGSTVYVTIEAQVFGTTFTSIAPFFTN